jgi:hypothetical protein
MINSVIAAFSPRSSARVDPPPPPPIDVEEPDHLPRQESEDEVDPPTQSVEKTIYVPEKPTFGGIKPDVNPKDGSEMFIPYTGGKPNSSFTDLQDPYAGPATPNAYRPQSAYAKQKLWPILSQYDHPKLSQDQKDVTLPNWQRKLNETLMENGLDSELYTRSMDPTVREPVNVILNHAQVTREHVQEQMNHQMSRWDEYSIANNTAAKELLFHSLDPSLEQELKDVTENLSEGGHTLTCAELYMELMMIFVGESFERHEATRKKLKELSPLDEPGENVKAYSIKAGKLCQELDHARAWQYELIMSILRALLLVTVPGFTIGFYAMQNEASELLIQTRHMSMADQHKIFRQKKLHYAQVLKMATSLYLNKLNSGDWPPALNVQDAKKAIDLNYVSLKNMTEAQVNALIQSKAQKTANKMIQKWKKKQGNGPEPSGAQDEKEENATPKHRNGKRGPSWREIAPKDGEPHTVTKNDTTYHWCSKCRRGKGLWSKTHKDADHDPQYHIKTERTSNRSTRGSFAGVAAFAEQDEQFGLILDEEYDSDLTVTE